MDDRMRALVEKSRQLQWGRDVIVADGDTENFDAVPPTP